MARNNRSSFLDEFFDNPEKRRKTELNRATIRHDKWDTEDLNHLRQQMKDLAAAEDRLIDVAPDTGGHLMGDAYFSLVKPLPELIDEKEIRPAYQINRAVMGEAMDLKEYEELRTYSTNDEIGAALACVSIEPELETLLDKLKHQIKQAQELEEQMQQYQQLDEEHVDVDKMLQDMADGNSDLPGDQEANLQAQKSLIEQQMKMLEQQIRQGAADLEDQLQQEAPMMKGAMKQAMKQAAEDAENMETSSLLWGLDPGYLHRLPPEKRIEMAKRLNTEKFRRLSLLFGPMQRLAFAEQQRKVIVARDEVYDLEFGNDLSLMLPTELMNVDDPDLEMDFWRRFVEQNLLQYKLRGTEKVAKGGVIFCEDGSGSMSGDPEIWAKAVGLALLHVAKMQKRSFYGIHFGGPGALKCFDFRDPADISIDRVLEFAEVFFAGGTDFVTPLSKSLDILREEFDTHGRVKGDIVFCSDGLCGVPDAWLEEFKQEQERMQFRVWGILIGSYQQTEPLNAICDGRVFTIKDIVTGDQIRDIFRGV